MYLLDTNVISELRRRERANRQVLAWADTMSPVQFFLSAITVLELEYGALLVERRDALQGASLRNWISGTILPQFEGRILPVDTTVALRCAALHVPDPRPERDSLIAATALVHGLIIVTRNTSDFQLTSAPLFNPWHETGAKV
ncbi:type II toxin-antitoxin system VapC family toxin [Mesorhizobium sp. CGMCC 1.15528]|uniref:Type II toxin-antitoxin system VapC family toxin n=1 Tax=Mesorhizobium zhangyense TaxID=1776730 RepID=A0A7C9R6M8_9HYPH|nr:type II toxin-antitoxin system VapC family toxin [Mesorhizobium zhangyense]NGN41362.1 type II toxin-antitoxin system VapC family toxin [Mesorhizobium zhangyense]